MADLNNIDIKLNNLASTTKFAKKMGSKLKGGEVIELSSDLGGGKTTFVKALVDGANSNDLVSSPTFTICNQYQAPNFVIYHFDFYRLPSPGIIKRELMEVIGDTKNVVVIEWPESIEAVLPKDKISINIQVTGDKSRQLHISYSNNLNYIF